MTQELSDKTRPGSLSRSRIRVERSTGFVCYGGPTGRMNYASPQKTPACIRGHIPEREFSPGGFRSEPNLPTQTAAGRPPVKEVRHPLELAAIRTALFQSDEGRRFLQPL